MIHSLQAGRRGLRETRAALERGGSPHWRVVEAAHAADVLLIVGSADWAEGEVGHARKVGDCRPMVVINLMRAKASTARVLDAGADDCVGFPFDVAELRARIRAVVRRLGPSWLRCPEIALDRATRRVRVRDVEARVSRKQLEIFICLAERRERWVHSEEIIATVSGTCHEPASSLVRVHIHALRKALGAMRGCLRCDGQRSYMLTLAEWGPAVSLGDTSNEERERRHV